MEHTEAIVVTPAATAPALDPATVTPDAVLAQVRAVRQLIPATLAIPAALALSRGRLPTIDSDFVNATVHASGASSELEGALGRTSDEIRQFADETVRWSMVEDEVRTLLQAIVASNTERRHRVGLTAIQTYRIAQQLVRQPEHADLQPHVQQMSRLNKFGRGSRRHKAAKPATTPAPTTPPTTPTTPAPQPHAVT